MLVNATYAKEQQSIDAGGITVSGEGPFTAKLEGHTLRISADGRARVLLITRPDWLWRPRYAIDGQEWMACWTDYPNSGWGSYKHTNLMAISVPDGKHELTVDNLVFPPVWERKFTPTIMGVEK